MSNKRKRYAAETTEVFLLSRKDVAHRTAVASIQHLSQDGRRIVRTQKRLPAPAPTSRVPPPSLCDEDLPWNPELDDQAADRDDADLPELIPNVNVQKERGVKAFATLVCNVSHHFPSSVDRSPLDPRRGALGLVFASRCIP